MLAQRLKTNIFIIVVIFAYIVVNFTIIVFNIIIIVVKIINIIYFHLIITNVVNNNEIIVISIITVCKINFIIVKNIIIAVNCIIVVIVIIIVVNIIIIVAIIIIIVDINNTAYTLCVSYTQNRVYWVMSVFFRILASAKTIIDKNLCIVNQKPKRITKLCNNNVKTML